MSKNKRIARDQAVETANAEVPANEVVNTPKQLDEMVAPKEVVETIESINDKMTRLKAELAEKTASLKTQADALNEKVKLMKAEEAEMKIAAKKAASEERFAKLQAKLVRPENTKRDAVISAILGTQDADGNYIIAPAASMEDVVAITGFDQKYVSDTVWGLEKSAKLR